MPQSGVNQTYFYDQVPMPPLPSVPPYLPRFPPRRCPAQSRSRLNPKRPYSALKSPQTSASNPRPNPPPRHQVAKASREDVEAGYGKMASDKLLKMARTR